MSTPEVDDYSALQRARDLWSTGHREEALQQYELAVRSRPHNVRACVEFAQVLGRVYKIQRAEELLQRAYHVAAGEASVIAMVARTYRGIYRPWQAITLLEELRECGNLPLPLLGELAILYEQAGHLEQADEAIAECVDKAPDHHEPRLVQARIQRERGSLDVAEQILLALTQLPEAPPMLHIRAWSELCLLRDRQADYEGAVAAIEKAKSIQRQSPEAERLSRQSMALNEAFRTLYAQLDADTLARWRSHQFRLEAECAGIAHLISFPRSGTTLIEQALRAHPNIIAAPERAIFSQEIFPSLCQLNGKQTLSLEAFQETTVETVIQLRSRYLDHHHAIHQQSLSGRVHLDKNPNHTSLMIGLYRLFPESRFICALRDPRDVVVSTYLRYFPLNEFSSSFLSWGNTCLLYSCEMNVWLRMRDLMSNNWLEVRYEQTVANIEQQSRRVVDFLSLDWDDSIKNYRDNKPMEFVNSPSRLEARQPVYSHAIGRWQNYQQYLEPHLAKLEPFLRVFGYR